MVSVRGAQSDVIVTVALFVLPHELVTLTQ